MDTIAYFTKKHCRSIFNIARLLLLITMGVVAFTGIPGAAGTAGGVVLVLMTLLCAFHMAGQPLGCWLLQIPFAILSFVSFFAGLGLSIMGFLALRYSPVEEDIHTAAASVGIPLDRIVHISGMPLGIVGMLLFFLSFVSFCAVMYLSTVKSCLSNVIPVTAPAYLPHAAFSQPLPWRRVPSSLSSAAAVGRQSLPTGGIPPCWRKLYCLPLYCSLRDALPMPSCEPPMPSKCSKTK